MKNREIIQELFGISGSLRVITTKYGNKKKQIATATGPCGNNRDYIFFLEKAIFDIGGGLDKPNEWGFDTTQQATQTKHDEEDDDEETDLPKDNSEKTTRPQGRYKRREIGKLVNAYSAQDLEASDISKCVLMRAASQVHRGQYSTSFVDGFFYDKFNIRHNIVELLEYQNAWKQIQATTTLWRHFWGRSGIHFVRDITLLRYFLESFLTQPGIVAEKSMFCLCDGSFSNICSTSSSKPTTNI
ncbi:unnamed protein product [Lactuca virosa]|uniref:Uncharacterized protein n=1 Tax=Lactuca virosa TaxID=75947 RepID=A0AAU9M1F2_9ASTR|nr:unnamed protein product [Lactuca virosa]